MNDICPSHGTRPPRDHTTSGENTGRSTSLTQQTLHQRPRHNAKPGCRGGQPMPMVIVVNESDTFSTTAIFVFFQKKNVLICRRSLISRTGFLVAIPDSSFQFYITTIPILIAQNREYGMLKLKVGLFDVDLSPILKNEVLMNRPRYKYPCD